MKHRLQRILSKFIPRIIISTIRKLRHQKFLLSRFKKIRYFFEEKSGLEIGGPSNLFSSELPIYEIVTALDNVNFANKTLWEKGLTSHGTFEFSSVRKSKGTQFICEASDLSEIQDHSYDFLISSNCLEHIANPIKALHEWKRVIGLNGIILLVVPRKESNFDHRRDTTSFVHIRQDFLDNTDEQSMIHLPEILELHDLQRDPAAGTFTEFHERSLANFTNRGLHHHVFDEKLLNELVEHVGFDVIYRFNSNTDYFCLARSKN